MRLVSLELQGFKSFVDKTKIEFNDGITAIVGPNGSGKSNIIEAIRWVMGETSAKTMRSDKMTDIIFSGTGNRKAVNIAQVTLRLDNSDRFLASDYDDLVITRRLKRDGQSDFFINNQSVRLKDIHDLFMDSGIGKESFSIIGQGAVDQVLNNKPEERRGIIEEAAGVLKYKNRKKEAEAKLEETKDNLDRVQDILYEIEKQKDSLEMDSKKAQRYLELSGELEDKDVDLTCYDICHLDLDFKKNKQALLKLEVDLRALDQDIMSGQAKLDELKQESQQLNAELDRLQDSILTCVRRKEQQESDLKLLQEQEKHKQEISQDLESQIQTVESQLEEYSQSLAELNISQENYQKQLDQKNQQISQVKQSIKNLEGNKEDVLSDMRTTYFELLREQSQYKNELSYLEKSMAQDQARSSRVQDDQTRRLEEEEQWKSKYKELEKELDDLDRQVLKLQESKAELVQKQEEVVQNREDLQQQVEQKRQTYQEKKAQYDSLSRMQDNYSGYYQGVQSVMRQKNKFPGMIGTVAELIQVPSHLEQAIDIALSSSSQFIVVRNQSVAQEAIDFLKKTRGGRATFLPLDRIRPRSIASRDYASIQNEEGLLGVASDLVTYSDEVASIIQYLLGQIVITQDLVTATRLSKRLNQRYKLVSLEGDVVNVGGSMTGGAHRRKQGSGLLSQNKQVERLEEEVQELAKAGQVLVDQVQDMKAQEDKLQDELLQLEESLQDIQENKKDHQFSIQQAEDKLTQLQKEIQASNFEYEEMNQELTENEGQVQQLEEKINHLQEAIDQQSSRMKQTEEDWQSRQENLGQFKQDLEQLEEEGHGLQLDLKSIEKEKDMIEDQQEKIRLEQEEYNQRLAALQGRDFEASRSDKQTSLDQDRDKLKALEEEQTSLQDQREELLLKQNEQEADLAESREQYNVYLNQQKKEEIAYSKTEAHLQSLLSYLNEHYEISYDDHKEKASQLDLNEEEISQLRRDIQALKADLKQLGPVNLASIEEYEETKERYDFLIEQRDDLYSAKDDIFSTMEEMDREVEERFYATFLAVKDKFSQIFPQIFGGGKADLILTDENDLLHTGIEIKAQPPGKNLRSLNLLSGGERSLTAISLLFAIIQANPIPFVIFDEVEAALDDANVLRFSQYLKKFKDEEIQFLVITHRKGTMEAADRLYGVVMQEQGVSSVLSVSLTQTDQFLD